MNDTLDTLKEMIELFYNAYIRFQNFLNKNRDVIVAFLEFFSELPELERKAGEKWIEFGWVPSLPNATFESLYEALDAPENQIEADQKMISFIETQKMETLFDELRRYFIDSESKTCTLNEAIACYENQLYTACVLCIYSLIDYSFLKEQPIVEEKRRPLPNKAIDKMVSEKEKNALVVTYATVGIIKELYRDGKNFTIEEKPLYRNFISHGMNDIIPQKTDCLKMFVLLYNVCLLFESDIFHSLLKKQKQENN